jgi:hypothetical protein
MNTEIRIANIIIIAAVALGVIVVAEGIILPAIESWAAGPGFPGCFNTPGANASKGRCFH